jgi:16S rRNA (cytosine967-C5)-methyltransferase
VSSDIPSKRIEGHARACAAVVAELLAQTLLDKRPADRSLANMLYKNRQLGARDRRIISETLFSVLRWWGWLRHLAPTKFTDALAAGSERAALPPLPLQHWYGCLAAAWFLDGRSDLPPSARWWLYQAGIARQRIKDVPAELPLRERRRCLRGFYPDGAPLPAFVEEDLLPSWCQAELACSRPLSELIEWQQRRAPVWLRAQTADVDRLCGELSKAEIKVERHARMRSALRISFSGLNLRTLPAFRAGRFEVQDLASQTVAQVCAPQPGELWWDACAGGGGKTLHLAWLMKGKGSVLASDIRAHKLQELKLRARRAQFPNIRCKEWRGVPVPRYNKLFHGVLVDTSCSCSGTWRRNPDGRWNSSAAELDELSALQTTLLGNAAQAVKSGGTLVYATCSMFKRENQDVVEHFLQSNPDFALLPFCCPLTGENCTGMQQLWPWDGDCDAMFIAKMRRS